MKKKKNKQQEKGITPLPTPLPPSLSTPLPFSCSSGGRSKEGWWGVVVVVIVVIVDKVEQKQPPFSPSQFPPLHFFLLYHLQNIFFPFLW